MEETSLLPLVLLPLVMLVRLVARGVATVVGALLVLLLWGQPCGWELYSNERKEALFPRLGLDDRVHILLCVFAPHSLTR